MIDNKWEFWVDRGGTFTDIVAKTPKGELKTLKLLSENPEQYDDAAVAGIRSFLGLNKMEAIPDNKIESVKMGTTVATNALLERKGDRTLLLVNCGFKDLLRIGYQNRPKLFDLEIKKQSTVFEEVIEVPGRLDALGREIFKIDIPLTKSILNKKYNEGYRSVAIAFIHSYLNSSHEDHLANIAKQIGFKQVSTSSGVSKLIKLVSRGDTAVVDAYLSPSLSSSSESRTILAQPSHHRRLQGAAAYSVFFFWPGYSTPRQGIKKCTFPREGLDFWEVISGQFRTVFGVPHLLKVGGRRTFPGTSEIGLRTVFF